MGSGVGQGKEMGHERPVPFVINDLHKVGAYGQKKNREKINL